MPATLELDDDELAALSTPAYFVKVGG